MPRPSEPGAIKPVRIFLASLLLANLIFIAIWNVGHLFSNYSTGQDLASVNPPDRTAIEVLGANAKYSFPSDDAWIHHQFARNLAERGALEFNPGVRSTGTTAPLWTAVLAVGQFIFGGSPAACFWFSNIVNIVFLYAALLLLVALAREIFQSEAVGWIAAFLTVNECHMSWALLSGMEIPLFIMLMLAAFVFFANERFILAGVAAGLCFDTRPVGLIVIAVLVADIGLRGFFARGMKDAWKKLLKISLTWFIAALPVLLVFLVLSGSVLPNTFYAKTNFYHGYHKAHGFLRSVFFHFSNDFFSYLAPFAIALVVEMFVLSVVGRKRHNAFPLLVFFALFIAAFAVTLPAAFQRARYFQPMFPIVILFMTAGAVGLLAGRSLLVSLITVPLIILAFLFFPIPSSGGEEIEFPFQHLKAVSLIGVALVLWLGTIDSVVRHIRPQSVPLTLNRAIEFFRGNPLSSIPGKTADFFRTYHAAAVRYVAAAVILAGSLVAFFSWGLEHAELYLIDCRYITDQHIVVGKWLSENTEPGDILATHDIGAVAYFSRRPVLDLIGLVEPDMIPYARVDSKSVIVIADEPAVSIIAAVIGVSEDNAYVFRTPAAAIIEAGSIASAAPEKNIALVIYDTPKSKSSAMEGIAALRGNSDLKQVPILVVTDMNTPVERNELHRAGANRIVIRPLDIAELSRIIVPYTAHKRHWRGRRLLIGEDEKSVEIMGRYSGGTKRSADYFVGFYQPGAGFFEDIVRFTPRGETSRFRQVYTAPTFARSRFGVFSILPGPPRKKKED